MRWLFSKQSSEFQSTPEDEARKGAHAYLAERRFRRRAV